MPGLSSPIPSAAAGRMSHIHIPPFGRSQSLYTPNTTLHSPSTSTLASPNTAANAAAFALPSAAAAAPVTPATPAVAQPRIELTMSRISPAVEALKDHALRNAFLAQHASDQASWDVRRAQYDLADAEREAHIAMQEIKRIDAHLRACKEAANA